MAFTSEDITLLNRMFEKQRIDIESSLEKKLEQKLEEKLELKLEQKLDQKLEEKLEQKLEVKLDQKLDEKMDNKISAAVLVLENSFKQEFQILHEEVIYLESKIDKRFVDITFKFERRFEKLENSIATIAEEVVQNVIPLIPSREQIDDLERRVCILEHKYPL